MGLSLYQLLAVSSDSMGGRGAFPERPKIPDGEVDAVSYMRGCVDLTKEGNPCKLEADEDSEYCHVHNPEKQCGYINRKGNPCRIPTGGRGPCPYHMSNTAGPPKPSRSRKRMHQKPANRKERHAERKDFVDQALAALDALY